MHRTRRMVLALVAAMALAAAPAYAMTWGGEVFGAFNTHSMSDWNDEVVDPINAAGGDMDEFNTGFGGGLGIRMWANPNWMFAGTWEPLFLTREEDVTGTEFKLDGNSFQVMGGYFFPTSGPAKFGIGAGVGYYMLSGEASDDTESIDLEGNAIGFHAMGMLEWTVSPGFAITGGAGYRIAKISDTEFDGVSADPEFETDYSGLMVRAGLAFYMPGASQ